MRWTARLQFKAGVAYRLTRYAVGHDGVIGESLATPYCPEGGLFALRLVDAEGRIFQIGTDAIDFRAKLPANTGSGLTLSSLGPFFEEVQGPYKWVEDSLASRAWESDPFEIDTDFNPRDLVIRYWTVPSPDGKPRQYVACDHITYCQRPLKMNVVDKGYCALADVEWRS